jgi:DNA-binding NarL/FixJ family response regulator
VASALPHESEATASKDGEGRHPAVSFVARIVSVIKITANRKAGIVICIDTSVHTGHSFGDSRPRSRSHPKEIQIGILVRGYLLNRDIAETLGISEQDVKNRLRGIFDKVGVWSRVELAMHAVEHPERWHAEGAGRQ